MGSTRYCRRMAQDEPRPEEARAAEVVRRLLLAQRAELRDVGGAPGMYDFDVLRDGMVVASVEVTIIADESALRTWNEKTLAPHRRGAGLRHGWSVTFSRMENARLKDVMPTVHAQLIALEAAGRAKLDLAVSQDDEAAADPAHAALRNLGLFSVDVVEGLQAGVVVLSSITADTVSWHALEDLIEARATLKGFQLAKADPGVERILFVWIDPSRQDLIATLSRWADEPFGPPPRTLDLPDGVDTVIVGVLSEANERFYRWPGFSPFNGGTALGS